MISLKDFYDMLEKHDWYYHFSDDGDVFRDGKKSEETLDGLSSESKAHHKLYQEYRAHAYSGIHFGKPKAAKPGRPE